MSLTPKQLLIGLIAGLCSLSAQAEWALNNADSSFYYVTSKAAAISEINTFTNLSGDIDNSGSAILEIDLTSVDTAIEIRDQRVKDMLFETQQYPTATVNIDIDSSALTNMDAGTSTVASYNYSLSLHGVTTELIANLRLTKISDSQIEIQPAQPLIIGASLFGLAEGVEALREVAGLPSINPNVIVDFSLSFDEGM
ncbi:MAG: YceI family protein [Gammaproteobacteria bacterium]|jgi:polyisoprenoid-binding protein YceI|nr:YceI family protein [Gammaproteobacteria bacterium]